MKKMLVVLMVIIMVMSSISVYAENAYGLSDESIAFLNEFNVDVDIFSEVFNGEEDEDTLESIENEIWSVKAQTRAYGFNEYQVHAMVNSIVDRILDYRKVEYVTIPKFKVTFNDQEVDSAEREYPLLQFRDITYFPMTYDDCRFLGLTTDWDGSAKKLTITKEAVENPQYNSYHSNPNREPYIYAEGLESVYIHGDVKNCTFEIEVNGKEVVNSEEEYPLLLFRNVTYFPLTWRFAVDEFGWEYSFDKVNGLEIKSK